MKKHGLSAVEKIKSGKEFEKIFTEGDTSYSSDNKIRANYCFINDSEEPGVLFAVAVSKKLGNAVWRNRVKRLIREIYRLNKIGLIEKCKNKNALLKIIFSPQALNQKTNKRIRLKDILPPIKEIISKLEEKI